MNKEKYKLEKEIREAIYDDNRNSTHFEYNQLLDTHEVKLFKVNVITLNRKTNATFLLTIGNGNTEIESLKSALENIKSSSEFQTFTIKWYIKGVPADRPFKSKFKAINISKAIDKFFHDENTSHVIYSISNDNIKSKEYEG